MNMFRKLLVCLSDAEQPEDDPERKGICNKGTNGQRDVSVGGQQNLTIATKNNGQQLTIRASGGQLYSSTVKIVGEIRDNRREDVRNRR